MYSERYLGDLRPADTRVESVVQHLETAETDALGFTTLKMPLIAGELLQCVIYLTINPLAYRDIIIVALLGKIPINQDDCSQGALHVIIRKWINGWSLCL